MKFITFSLIVGFSINLLAKPITRPLENDEISLAIFLTNKYEIPLIVNGPCSKAEFDIISMVKGFNPASWFLETNKIKLLLVNHDEITGLISLYDRLKVPAERINSITTISRVTIVGSSCGFTPNKWTATFENYE